MRISSRWRSVMRNGYGWLGTSLGSLLARPQMLMPRYLTAFRCLARTCSGTECHSPAVKGER